MKRMAKLPDEQTRAGRVNNGASLEQIRTTLKQLDEPAGPSRTHRPGAGALPGDTLQLSKPPAGEGHMPIFRFYRKHGAKRVPIGITVLLAAIAAGAAAYFLVPGIRVSEPENTARYFPDDTLAYSWATLNPGADQGRHLLDIWERFNEIPEFQDTMEELLDEFQDDTGMDFKEEVLPWIGPDVSLAALDAGGLERGLERGLESFDAVAMFGVKDHDAAASFLETWLEYMENENEAQFEEDSSGDFDIRANEGEQQIYALSRDWLVFATTEDALEEVLDRISGDGGDSLADNPDFKQARALMSDPRVMSLYVELETATDALSDVSGDLIPGWLAVSARFVDRGMVMEIVAPGGTEFAAGLPGVGEPAVLLPDDTLGFIAASFDPNMDNWRLELERYTLDDLGLPHDFEHALEELKYGMGGDGERRELDMQSTLAETLDYGIEIVEELTGINLEEDLFDHLNGRAIISVRDFEFDRAEDFQEHAVDMVAMLSYIPDNRDDLRETMDRVTGLIESSGLVRSDSVDVGADVDATVFDLGDVMGETAYSPGYALNDGYFTIGSTERVLEAAAVLQNGGGDALADAPEYRRARGHLPDAIQSLMFLDLQRITGQLDQDDMDMDPGGYQILAEGFSAVAIGSKAGADYSRWVFVLTLFPE